MHLAIIPAQHSGWTSAPDFMATAANN